jgi:squalene synthase HpnC
LAIFPWKMNTDEAFAYCRRIAREHYENFPVASSLLPRDRRPHVASIYAFARTADDFADEGTLPPAERLRRLDDWQDKLAACYRGEAEHPLFIALRSTVEATGVPQDLFIALLQAFRMDVVQPRYLTYDDLMNYCAKSANPVGRLVLHLFGAANETTVRLSDHVCTALQLTNFWQDVAVDAGKGRIYIPLEDFRRFGYTEEDLKSRKTDDRFRALMRFQIERTRRLFNTGAELIGQTGGRLRRELAATLWGGRAILDAIERNGYDALGNRPTLSAADKIWMIVHAVTGTSL